MNDATAQVEATGHIQSWHDANQAYLDDALLRIRLLLKRRVLWLRSQWKQDPLQSYQTMVISEAEADRLLQDDDPAAEAQFYRENPDAAAISQTLAAVEQRLATQKQRLIEAGAPASLDLLASLFDLTSFEQDVLALCLAPALDARFGRLYGYVQDDAVRKYPTPHLALTLFTDAETLETRRPAYESFLPDAPLYRYQLLQTAPPTAPTIPLSTRPLSLDERMTAYLQGHNTLDERIAPLLRPVPAAPPAPAHGELAQRMAYGLTRDAAEGVLPVINLAGASGAGQPTLARAFCDQIGLHLFQLNTERLPTQSHERETTLRLLMREAVLVQLAFYLDATDFDPADRDHAQAIDEVVERLNVPLFIGSHERWLAQREVLTIRLPELDTQAQRALWQQALAGIPHQLNGHIDALVQQFRFSPEAIVGTVAAARRKAYLRAPETETPLGPDDLWQACREASGQRLDKLCQPIIPRCTWDDIVLPDDVSRQLMEVAAQVAHRARVYETWGFGARMNRGQGISALFSGASGTGKTMAAEIMAHHLQLDLYRIDLASMVSKYIGETEKNLKKVFDAAEQSGAILFFDEADALFGKRTEVKDSHDRYANIEVDYLLQRMEAYRGLAILATNRKADLDKAFLRRIRFMVTFPFPDARSRRRIWQKSFSPEAPIEAIDFEALSRLEIPGGNIKNIVLNAAFLAAEQDTRIRMEHVLHATRREYQKIDKLITKSEFGRFYPQMTP